MRVARKVILTDYHNKVIDLQISYNIFDRNICKRAFKRGLNHIIWLKDEGDMIFPN
jgi:hypothetical protein